MLRTFPRFQAVVLALSLMAAACGEDTSEGVDDHHDNPTATHPGGAGSVRDLR